MFNLKDQVAVITGASSGLGRQMSHAFAEQGANLAILARRFERLEALKAELEEKYGIKVLPIQCDVTDTESINAAAEKVEAEYGKVDILLNCAGSSKDKGVLDMTDDEWDFTISTDLTSVFKMTRAFANIMKKNHYGRRKLHPCRCRRTRYRRHYLQRNLPRLLLYRTYNRSSRY